MSYHIVYISTRPSFIPDPPLCLVFPPPPPCASTALPPLPDGASVGTVPRVRVPLAVLGGGGGQVRHCKAARVSPGSTCLGASSFRCAPQAFRRPRVTLKPYCVNIETKM